MWNGQAKKTKLGRLEPKKKKGSLLTDKEHEYKEKLGRQKISTECKKTE